MKKTIIYSSLVLSLIFSACNNSSNSSANFRSIDTTKLAKGTAYYQCEMHPDEISDTTGACPVCGDELIEHTKQ